MKHIKGLACILIILLISGGCKAPVLQESSTENQAETDQEIITFHDPNLEKAVRKKLRFGENTPINKADALSIKELSVDLYYSYGDNPPESHIVDLQDLSYFENVETLWFEGCHFANIDVLTELSRLKDLTFSRCDVSGLLCFPKSIQLQKIYIARSGGLNNLDFLRYQKSLREISLFECCGSEDNVSLDISILLGIPSLEAIFLSRVGVMDFSPLGKMKQLKSLSIRDIGISDISFLMNLTSLEELDLFGTDVAVAALRDKDPTALQMYEDLKQALPNCDITWWAFY